MVLVTEHDHVITLGRAGNRENLFSRIGPDGTPVEVVSTERGGDVTYHGPGQLMVYPILDLKTSGLSVSGLVTGLEETGIRFLAEYGLSGGRSSVGRGVFIEDRKVQFIGVAVKKYVSLHGLSLNLDPDLRFFSLMNPCGLRGLKVTSLREELGTRCPTMEEASTIMCRVVREFFSNLPAGGRVSACGGRG